MKSKLLSNYCALWALLTLLVAMSNPILAQNFQFNGSASQTSCDCFELTPAQESQHGSAWNLTQLDLTESFDLDFRAVSYTHLTLPTTSRV